MSPGPVQPGLTSILTPVFNNLHCVVLLYKSLVEQTRDAPFELILVDNGSTEAGAEAVYREIEADPRARVIRNGENLGFGKGNNIGLAHCRGEFIALINSDMFFVRPWLSPLLERFAADARLGAAQGVIVLPEEGLPLAAWKTQTCGARFDAQGLPQYRLPGVTTDDPGLGQPFPLEAFMGTGVVLRRRAIEETGFFDEAFDLVFMEDTDLSLRLSQAGWSIWLEPRALFVHLHSASMPHLSQEVYDRSRRANLALFRRRWPAERIRDVLARHGFSTEEVPASASGGERTEE